MYIEKSNNYFKVAGSF